MVIRKLKSHLVASQQHSYLFLVRFWLEPLGEGRTEWRGQVQTANGDQVRYFRDWETLITCLRAMLPDAPAEEAESSKSD